MQAFEDDVYPTQGISMPDPEMQGRRYEALAIVLCDIPEDDYETLKSKIDSFVYFIPEYETQGYVYPFPATVYPPEQEQRRPYVRVLYLSPVLEQRADDTIVAAVAHELAHIVLDHRLHTTSKEQYEQQEDAAWQRVRDWGLERQVTKSEAMHKREETRKRKLIEEYKREHGFE